MKLIKIQITYNFRLPRNDPIKHKIGQKNKRKAYNCSKDEFQNVSQLSSHHFGTKYALAFDSKSTSQLVYESLLLFAKSVMPLKVCVHELMFCLNRVSNTNYSKMPLKYKILKKFGKPEYKLQIL